MTLKVEVPKTESRNVDQLKEHYEVEKELAGKLRNSVKQERRNLYNTLYDELFRRVPHHSQLTREASPKTFALTNQRIQFLSHFLGSDTTFLEVGSGDCSFSFAVAEHVKAVYAVDVSEEIIKKSIFPQNVKFFLSDGCSIPVPESSVDLAYSHQLMEHLHPDDAAEQLQNIYKALADGGVYVCITPNRLCGPHDISKYFDEVATGFHLKEYTVTELYRLFRTIGFSKVSLYKTYRQMCVRIPLFSITVFVFKICEVLLNALPFRLRRKIANTPILFRGMTIVGVK